MGVTHKVGTDEVREKAALYALGALSQLEARGFEVHLREGCEVCQSELLEFEEVVGVLGLDAPEASPPAELRSRLLSRIASEPQEAPTTRLAPEPSHREQAPARAQARQSGRVPSGGGESGGRWFPWAIAACLAILALVSLLAWRRADEQIGSIIAESARDRALAKEEKDRAEEETQINKLLEIPGSVKVDLTGLSGHPAARGVVYWDKQNNRWIVDADLPPAPPGKEYQLWFLAPSPVSAGLIKTDSIGHGFSVVGIPSGLGQIGAAAITLEPEGGSQKPTQPIYALGKTS
jgi:anti-sigma-K factor RskA